MFLNPVAGGVDIAGIGVADLGILNFSLPLSARLATRSRPCLSSPPAPAPSCRLVTGVVSLDPGTEPGPVVSVPHAMATSLAAAASVESNVMSASRRPTVLPEPAERSLPCRGGAPLEILGVVDRGALADKSSWRSPGNGVFVLASTPLPPMLE